MNICHCVVLTNELANEWEKHESKYSKMWRFAMKSKRKIFVSGSGSRIDLFSEIAPYADTKKFRMALMKDIYLLQAALQSDRIILSTDDNAKSFYNNVAFNVKHIADIMWVNPLVDFEDTITWLENGAPSESKRCLGHRS